MKLYQIPRGTLGLLLHKDTHGCWWDETSWETSQKLHFSETVLDPISLHNGRKANDTFIRLVEKGYALFQDTQRLGYVLAVPYNRVTVL